MPRTSFWHQKRETRDALAFMRIFHKEITKRIKPDDRIHTEYIPSQVFTEYLRYVFKLEGEISVDGMIYNSSVNERHCIVLFFNQKESKKYLELVEIEDKNVGRMEVLMGTCHLCLKRRKQKRVPSNDETLFTENG